MAKITKLEIEIGKRTISLTPEECNSLQAALEEMFGKKEVVHTHSCGCYRPWNYFYQTVCGSSYDSAGLGNQLLSGGSQSYGDVLVKAYTDTATTQADYCNQVNKCLNDASKTS